MLQRLTYCRLKLIFPPTACVQRYSQLLSEAQHFVSIPNIEIAWSGHEHNGQFAGSILLERHHADSNEAAFGFNEGQGDRIKVAARAARLSHSCSYLGYPDQVMFPMARYVVNELRLPREPLNGEYLAREPHVELAEPRSILNGQHSVSVLKHSDRSL